MKKKCLVYVIHPIHFISTMTALKQLNKDDVDVYVLVSHPYLSKRRNYQIFKIINILSCNNNLIKEVIFFDNLNYELLINNLNRNQFNEIYYTVDFVTELHTLLFELFPDAKRICVGDALGMVCEKKVVFNLIKKTNENDIIDNYYHLGITEKIYNYITNLRSITKKKKPSILLMSNKEYEPHHAVLILPVDQSGNFLKNIPLTVCNKKIFLDTVYRCMECCYDLKKYIKDIIKQYKKKKYLLLTENISEGNFIEYNREIEMWCDIIETYCQKNSVIFLKSHPGEVFNRNKLIRKKLGKEYCVRELEKKFKRYPIELWKDLLLNSTVISLTYPNLSLKYLYNIDVINPMDEAFIEKWFPKWTWVSYKDSISLYMEPLKRLPSWDGKSVLYAGNIKNV